MGIARSRNDVLIETFLFVLFSCRESHVIQAWVRPDVLWVNRRSKKDLHYLLTFTSIITLYQWQSVCGPCANYLSNEEFVCMVKATSWKRKIFFSWAFRLFHGQNMDVFCTQKREKKATLQFRLPNKFIVFVRICETLCLLLF